MDLFPHTQFLWYCVTVKCNKITYYLFKKQCIYFQQNEQFIKCINS
jgi:hypothetical protein